MSKLRAFFRALAHLLLKPEAVAVEKKLARKYGPLLLIRGLFLLGVVVSGEQAAYLIEWLISLA